MNLTSKSRYALKIMMDLAHYGATQPLVRRGEIAARQGVPTDYLDQIMIKLRSGHLVESTRGRSGGYKLARHPGQITMWDLFSTVEESMVPVECITSGHECDFERSCSSKAAWTTIFGALKQSLSTITLQQLADDWSGEVGKVRDGLIGATAGETLTLVQECRGGGRCENEQHAGCIMKSSEKDGCGANQDG